MPHIRLVINCLRIADNVILIGIYSRQKETTNILETLMAATEEFRKTEFLFQESQKALVGSNDT